ncbi:FAD-dependent oxidoreductase [Klugiella xanthotipulae]|uniref:Thioredoxin reductase n=1 Tax=Klugiella xanthotipulae TaxID=244735 RepID=A0A543I668_9MICO|nr:FAD-dependent oxidoreductase [Klugiella xanthotipulae]TQM66064.1 thioredoxin reductase [Klugiella xanthotipulae]
MTLVDVALSVRPTDRLTGLPVAVIGAGPIGLAAAAQLRERDLDVVVLEAGDSAGTAVAAWGHTRLFTPWSYLIDEAAARLLDATGWNAPQAEKIPFGHELVTEYLEPLARTAQLEPIIRYGQRVVAVSRQGMDRTRSVGREAAPFVLRVKTVEGTHEVLARAVIDTSGTYFSPNKVISSGLDPIDADAVNEYMTHALPDVLGADRARFAGKRTLVVGAGHSAANTLLALAELATEVPETRVIWAIRSANPARVYGSAADELAARGQLGGLVRSLVDDGRIELIDGYEIDTIVRGDDHAVNVAGRRGGASVTIVADTVVNATGFRPDLDMLREIRLSLDSIVEAPAILAPLIDPNLHSCGTVYPHGVVELAHPEPNFFIAGMKSYGRAPTFLLATGYEQVRSIADELAGNYEAARTVDLVLPETGVCNAALPREDGTVTAATVVEGGCCS